LNVQKTLFYIEIDIQSNLCLLFRIDTNVIYIFEFVKRFKAPFLKTVHVRTCSTMQERAHDWIWK